MFTIKYHLTDQAHTVITHTPYTEDEIGRLRKILEAAEPGAITLQRTENRDETIIPVRNVLYIDVIEQ